MKFSDVRILSAALLLASAAITSSSVASAKLAQAEGQVQAQPAPPESDPAVATPPETTGPAATGPATTPSATTPSATTKPPRTPAFTGPMLITVRTQIPALINGKKTTTDFVRTLNIPDDRAALLRQAGTITPSLDADLNKFLTMLEHVGQDARFMQLDDGTWAAVQRNNLVIDRAATRANVLALIQNARSVRADVVVTGQSAPKRTLDFFVNKGITSFLATGQTSYYSSSQARVTNIHVGATNFKDRLFEGKTFSFNQMVGPITAKNGYQAGLVIAGDQTASGVGGGICQVSTTVFRALFGAGLPIVQRQNHSYQVHYYDPQGLDATIYQPSLDLKFANNTGGALWFQTDWDDQENTLTVSVFGKAPKYDVVIEAPKTLSTTPSPKDRLINDPTLAAGTRQQIDWAAPGAVIEVTRRFMQGGKEVRRDVLKSSYRPWPNIYKVGTKK